MVYAGIDVHKRCTQICIEGEDGTLVERRILTERRRLIEEFGERPQMRILLEAATESEWVARCLEKLGHEVVVGDPNFAPMYAQRSRRIKTDRRDARALLEACKVGAYKRSHRCSDEHRRVALLLGMRASEIVSRVVRDLDDEGRLLWIPTSKTEAGKRTLHVPEVLRPYLQRLTEGQAPEALIFGEHWRDWVRKAVRRICKAAKVPEVTAHGMRGLHSTLAMEAGVTGAVVAASLGHEHVSTTITSYAKPEAVAGAQQRRTLKVLQGGR
jgi:integrase